MTYRLTPQAEADLAAIYLWIAQDSLTAADAVLDQLYERFVTLAQYPHLGRAADLSVRDLRVLPVGNLLIFYRALVEGIEVYRILSGYRDIEAALEG